MLWVAFLLVGVASACAAVSTFAIRIRYGADTLTLAQLLSSRMKELDGRPRSDLPDEGTAAADRVAMLREIVEATSAKRPQASLVGGDPLSRVAIGLAALALVAFSLLAATSDAPSPLADGLTASSQEDPDLARLQRYANSKPLPRWTAGPMSTPREAPRALPDVDTMIERLAARLQSQPDDAEGWRMLGWSYFHVQQPTKAVEAYAQAVALRPQSSEFKSAYGEAIVGAEGGTVTPKALEEFNGALAIDAQDAKARYFVAVGKLQAGSKKDAFEDLLRLQAKATGDEPWMVELRERTEALARELNVNMAARVPASALESDPKGFAQPTPEQVRSVQALPADQQQAMIREMVEGLAKRLQENPRDEQGWLRLMRSRVVLGEQQAARDALKSALATFSDDAPAGARIGAVAKELGIAN